MAKKRVRDYEKEYRRDHSKPEDIKDRAARNAARRDAMAEGKVKKGDGKEVDHKRPLSKGGGNSKSNTRVVSRTTNRKKADKMPTKKKGK